MSLLPTYRPTWGVPSRAMTDTAESPRRGRPPGVKLKDRGMLRLDDDRHARLVALAALRGVTVANLVREAIDRELARAGA